MRNNITIVFLPFLFFISTVNRKQAALVGSKNVNMLRGSRRALFEILCKNILKLLTKHKP